MSMSQLAERRKSRRTARRKLRRRTRSNPKAAHVAFQRFGLGAKPGVFASVAKNPLRALMKELDTRGIADIKKPGLPTYREAARLSQFGFQSAQDVFRAELDARIDKQMSVKIGFVERLVMFWSNHFSMSIDKCEAVRGTIGQLERDVIRKHVLGNFTDMLIGVMKHPAMIAFLDNADSIGPSTEVARWSARGNNENLAREVMELHTVGSGGGYTEDDVKSLALILTGWSYVRGWEVNGGWNGGTERNRGQFIFRADWHEPGPKRLMGKPVPGKGVKKGIKVLRRLAASPYTAENIAFKLVRHFITDTPSPEQVEPLAKVFRKTRGNLKAMAKALIQMPGALDGPLTKIRTPYENAVAQFRAIGRRYDAETKKDYWSYWCTLEALKGLPFECPSPQGYPDETAHWLNPDAMTIRLDTALLNAWVYASEVRTPPRKLASRLFGRALSPASGRRIAAASDRFRGFTTLFMTPEFQRR